MEFLFIQSYGHCMKTQNGLQYIHWRVFELRLFQRELNTTLGVSLLCVSSCTDFSEYGPLKLTIEWTIRCPARAHEVQTAQRVTCTD